MAVAMLATPVMGAPATKIEGVTIEVVGGGPVPYPGFPRMVSDGTIGHGKGYAVPGSTVTLTIPTVGTYPDGVWESEWLSSANYKKVPAEVVIRSHVTMTFAEGTFEGVNQRRITGNPMDPITLEDSAVLHGTGIFKGQTLKLTREAGSAITIGYIIMP